jgi:Dna[CI] antecedent, DciA
MSGSNRLRPSRSTEMPEEPTQFSRVAEDLIASLRRMPLEIPRGMRKRPTKDLGPLIAQILVDNQIGCDSPEQTIRDKWAEIVGAANASYSHPARIERQRSLVVLASHSPNADLGQDPETPRLRSRSRDQHPRGIR